MRNQPARGVAAGCDLVAGGAARYSPAQGTVRSESDTSQEIYDTLRQRYGGDDPRAGAYRSVRWFYREREFVLRAVGGGAGTVLDVGCGSGLVTLPLVRAGRPVIGVDLNRAACEQARRNGLQAMVGNAADLPVADAAVDVVVMVELFQECSAAEAERVLREAARALRAGGRLVIAWPNRKAWVHRAATAVLRMLNSLQHAMTHHPPPRMRARAARAGLELVEWFSIFPPWGMRLRRVGGPLVALIGSHFIAVFRKGAATPP